MISQVQPLIGAQKKQAILLILYLKKLRLEDTLKMGLSKNELLQTIHKLKKDGYNIVYDKKTNTYHLINKDKPLILDVKVLKKIDDYSAEGVILGKIPVILQLHKTKLNGSPYIRVKCKVLVEDGKIVIMES